MVLGISITDDTVIIKYDKDDQVKSYPLILNKLKNDIFEIGERAFEESLNNNGVLIDKLVYKSLQNKEVKIDNQLYQVSTLFKIYFQNLFLNFGDIEFVCVSINNNNPNLFKDLDIALYNVLYDRKKFLIITNSDAFLKYTNQLFLDDNINSTVGLIDFIDKSVIYYELYNKKITGYDKDFIIVDTYKSSPIPLDLLNENNGNKIIDGLLNEFAKKITLNKLYSYFFISGYGFRDQDKFRDFINFICSLGCPVLKEENLFAIGAYNIALDNMNNITNDKNYYITDNRTNFQIYIYDEENDNKELICDFGTPWFLKQIKLKLIVYNTNKLIFNILKLNGDEFDKEILLNENFVIRDNKTTMVEVSIEFSQYNMLHVLVKDIGFGEFYQPIENAINTGEEINI